MDGDIKLESDNGPKVLGFDFCLRGIAVEKETANDREVLVISKDHVALCSLNRAMAGRWQVAAQMENGEWRIMAGSIVTCHAWYRV